MTDEQARNQKAKVGSSLVADNVAGPRDVDGEQRMSLPVNGRKSASSLDDVVKWLEGENDRLTKGLEAAEKQIGEARERKQRIERGIAELLGKRLSEERGQKKKRGNSLPTVTRDNVRPVVHSVLEEQGPLPEASLKHEVHKRLKSELKCTGLALRFREVLVEPGIKLNDKGCYEINSD